MSSPFCLTRASRTNHNRRRVFAMGHMCRKRGALCLHMIESLLMSIKLTTRAKATRTERQRSTNHHLLEAFPVPRCVPKIERPGSR